MQPLAQFLAAFPANLLFPFVVVVIATFKLNPNIWLTPLMILGTQWYILFNVIAGASAFPSDLSEAATLYKRALLAVVAQRHAARHLSLLRDRRDHRLGRLVECHDRRRGRDLGRHQAEGAGLGAYIAKATEAGDFHRVVLGIAVMSVFVVLFNRLLWRPLYAYAERKLRFD